MGKNIDCNNNDFEIKGIKLVKYHGKNKNVLVPKEVRFVLKGAFENCDFIEYITFQSKVYCLLVSLCLIKGLISKQRIKQLISYIKLYFKLVIQINKILFFMKIIGKKEERYFK